MYSAKRSLSLGWGSSLPRVRTSSTIARRVLDRHEPTGTKGRAEKSPDRVSSSPRSRARRQNPCMATTDPHVGSGTEEWKKELYEAAPERQGELFSTISGLENEPLYTPDST